MKEVNLKNSLFVSQVEIANAEEQLDKLSMRELVAAAVYKYPEFRDSTPHTAELLQKFMLENNLTPSAVLCALFNIMKMLLTIAKDPNSCGPSYEA